MKKDELLLGNEKIEESIVRFKVEPTDENLTLVLSLLRKRMKENGEMIVAIRLNPLGQRELRPVQTGDGKQWFAAFTSFDEQNAGGDGLQSGFTANLGQLFQMALQVDAVEGIIINPWNKNLVLDKALIKIIMG